MTATATKTSWRMVADEVASCNCAWGCPCQFNALPTQGRCEAFIGWQIKDGRYGQTSLNGLRFAGIVSFPGAIHEGNGTMQLIIDEQANQEQQAALAAICS